VADTGDGAELPLFNALRDWCAERSKRDGVPPYVICTNRQCAAMVKARPQSLSKLAEIEGFGKAKLEKYGQEILALLARAALPLQAPAARPEDPETRDERAQS
jgi:superfamily II DNA helicase RecQ